MRSPRSTSWWRPLAGITFAVIVVAASMEGLDMDPNVPLVAAVVVFCAALLWTYASLQQSTVVPQRIPRAVAAGPADGADRSVRSIRSTIVFGRWLGSNQLHERLVAIIDDRLEARHGLDRFTDPDGAGAVLGPELQRFIQSAGDDDRLPPVRELQRIVDRIERL